MSETKQTWPEYAGSCIAALAGVRLATDAPGTVRALIVAAQAATADDVQSAIEDGDERWAAMRLSEVRAALRDALAAFEAEVPA